MNTHSPSLPLWSRLLRQLVVLLCCGLLLTPHTLAQTAPEPQPAVEPVRPETPEFQAAADEVREHLKKMRALLVRFNTSLDSQGDSELRQQWFDLQQAGVPLHQRMVDAALVEYLSDPAGKKQIAEMLWGVLAYNAKVDRYEGMLPVAQALSDAGYPGEDLRGITARTALANNQFAALKPVLNELVNQGMAGPELQRLQTELSDLEKLWADELAAREADAQGELLPRVLMHTTKGDIELELFENQAPETVANFISLVESGFYKGLTFHRVLENFMAQTGCPNGDGSGGPGYAIYNEAGKPGARKFFRGSLAMALSQDPNSGGSQFFITFLPSYELNNSYTVFGRVLSGFNVLGNIVCIDPEDKKKKEESNPAESPDEIVSMEVLYKRDHEYKPTKVK